MWIHTVPCIVAGYNRWCVPWTVDTVVTNIIERCRYFILFWFSIVSTFHNNNDFAVSGYRGWLLNNFKRLLFYTFRRKYRNWSVKWNVLFYVVSQHWCVIRFNFYITGVMGYRNITGVPCFYHRCKMKLNALRKAR